MIEHLSPFNPGFVIRLEELKNALAAKLGAFNDTTQMAGGYLYRMLQREANALAFNDAFFAQMIMFAGLLRILFFIRKPPAGHRAGPGAH
jgi:DHA2 family multidrug resistance protein